MSSASDRVVVYDGDCHICSGWVKFFERHPVKPPFSLIPMQSSSGRDLLARSGIDPDDPSTLLVLDRGLAYTASDAVIHVMAAAGGPWRLVRGVRIVPRPWRDALYGVLARNRYRWFGNANPSAGRFRQLRRAHCARPQERSGD